MWAEPPIANVDACLLYCPQSSFLKAMTTTWSHFHMSNLHIGNVGLVQITAKAAEAIARSGLEVCDLFGELAQDVGYPRKADEAELPQGSRILAIRISRISDILIISPKSPGSPVILLPAEIISRPDLLGD